MEEKIKKVVETILIIVALLCIIVVIADVFWTVWAKGWDWISLKIFLSALLTFGICVVLIKE